VVGLAYRGAKLIAGGEVLLSTAKGRNHPPDLGVMEVGESQKFELRLVERDDFAWDRFVVVGGGVVDPEGPSRATPDGPHRCSKPMTIPPWQPRAELSLDDALAVQCALETYIFSDEAVKELGTERARRMRVRVHKPVITLKWSNVKLGTFDVEHVAQNEVRLREWLMPNLGNDTWQVLRARLERTDGGGWVLREFSWKDERR